MTAADGWIRGADAHASVGSRGGRLPLGADAMDRPAVDLLADIAQTHPERIACEDATRVLHFGELLPAVRRLAALVSLAAADRPGPVGILLPFGMSYLTALFACTAAGRPCVLLDARFPPERNQEMIRSTGVALLIVEDMAAGGTSDIPLLLADRAFDASSAVTATPASPLDVDAPAFILCTSGSTGRPRSFAMSQRGALHRAAYHVHASVMGQDDRVMCLSSPSTVGGAFTLFGFPLAGAAVQVADLAQGGFRALVETLRSRKVTILRAGPPMLRALAQLPGAAAALASLRNVTIYGEATLLSDVALLRSVLPEQCGILVAYGSTEAPGTGWFASPDDGHDPVRAPAGRLQPGVDAMIVDDDGAAVPAGEVGELLIRSRYTALGEWQDGRCVPGSLLPDPGDAARRIHRTGDLARRTADDVFVILGRKDRMVQINGQRVEPAEVETALRRHPAVLQAAVVARVEHDAVSLHAFVVLDTGASIEPAALRAALRQTLPGFMVPSTISVLAALPLLPSGKIDEKALLAMR